MDGLREITDLVLVTEGVCYLKLQYQEGHAVEAHGSLVIDAAPKGGAGRNLTATLTTQSYLAGLWASPTNHLWVGTAAGEVFTNGPVAWPSPRGPVEYAGVVGAGGQLEPGDWSVTSLPDLPEAGRAPQIIEIWGTSDDDVHVGTGGGAMYHWDGASWRTLLRDSDADVIRMHGTGPTDVWAVGSQGLILHFDGKSWTRLPYPGDGGSRQALTGVRCLSPNEVVITSRSGSILHGSQHGLEVLGEFPTSFYGISLFQDRLILAAGLGGVWELKGNQAEMIRDTFGAVAVHELGSVLGFLMPESVSAFIVYDPDDEEMPWARVTYS